MNEITKIIVEIWQITTEMSFYLLFGFFMAGILHVLLPQKLVEKHLSGKGIMKSIKAALIGVPMPLCSCGVIPVTASLRKHGAGRGATVSFLTSTPQTGVDSIMITYGMLGWIFAVFRVITAFISGILCGTAVEIFDPNGGEIDNNNKSSKPDSVETGIKEKFYEFINYGFVVLPRDIGKALIVGLVIAGILGAMIPQNFFAGFIDNTFLSMVVMMLIGLPLYVCSTASVPVAVVFLHTGLSPGAVLVFLITGPATNAATITTIAKILSKRTAIIYLITIAVCAFIAGFILNMLDVGNIIMSSHSHSQMVPFWLKTVSAVVMVLVLINALIPRRKRSCESTSSCKDKAVVESEEKITISIKGMRCSHCVDNIKRSLLEVKGVKTAEVILKDNKAYISGKDFDKNEIIKAIESLGYEVE